MGQKVTMNESQLRQKVYEMVCESLEELYNEGKTFKDQRGWDKKGFQKGNKFDRNKFKGGFQKGQQMGSGDQDECMHEGEC